MLCNAPSYFPLRPCFMISNCFFSYTYLEYKNFINYFNAAAFKLQNSSIKILVFSVLANGGQICGRSLYSVVEDSNNCLWDLALCASCESKSRYNRIYRNAKHEGVTERRFIRAKSITRKAAANIWWVIFQLK